jgi:osmotically-inducible protein OsmY
VSIFFGTKYKDEKLIASAEKALSGDPTIDTSRLTISSLKGVVTVEGKLKTSMAKRHALETVARVYHREALKFDKILDRIEIG